MNLCFLGCSDREEYFTLPFHDFIIVPKCVIIIKNHEKISLITYCVDCVSAGVKPLQTKLKDKSLDSWALESRIEPYGFLLIQA